jgi:2-polyprenyl-6-methoxyphenol hydroxylase-like FAD-dependent oxidoreductase
MMIRSGRAQRVLVLGAGPVGSAAAIVLARRFEVTLDFWSGASDRPRRVDALPLQTVAVLIELGVHPEEAGISERYETILSAWEEVSPKAVRGFPKVHVDRRRLDAALLARARRTPRVSLVKDPPLEAFDLVVDATGRRALTASKVYRPGPAWVASVCSFEGRFTPAQAAFRIAALPDGYAYRLGSPETLTLGFVGPAPLLRQGEEALMTDLHDAGADWILAGLTNAAQISTGRGGACSMQSAVSSRARLLGDAAFAPDILAAQGLARGLADAVALGDPGPRRQQDVPSRIAAHRLSLRRAVARCTWRNSATWSIYRQGLLGQGQARSSKREGPIGASPITRTG